MIPWPPPRALMNIALAGALVRLLGLGLQPVDAWEAAIWAEATGQEGVWLGEAPGWLPTQIARVTTAMGGAYSATALRIVSAIAGVIGIVFAYALAIRLLDPSRQPRRGGFARSGDPATGRNLALWFTGFYAAHSTVVDLAQHAGGLSIALTCTMGLWCAVLSYVDEARTRALVGIAVASIVLLLAHPLGAVMVAGALIALVSMVRIQAGEHVERQRWLPPLWLQLALTFGVLGLLVATDPSPWNALIRTTLPGSGAGSGWTLATWVSGALCVPALAWGVVRSGRSPASRLVGLGLVGIPVLGLILLVRTQAIDPHAAALYGTLLLPGLWWMATTSLTKAPTALRVLLLALLALGHIAPLAVALGSEATPAPYGQAGSLGERQVPTGWQSDPEHPLFMAHEGHAPGRPSFNLAAAFVLSHSTDAQSGEATPGHIVILHGADLEARWRFHAQGKLPTYTLPRDGVLADFVRDHLHLPLSEAKRVYFIQGPESHEGDEEARAALTREILDRTSWGRGDKLALLGPVRIERAGTLSLTLFDRHR